MKQKSIKLTPQCVIPRLHNILIQVVTQEDISSGQTESGIKIVVPKATRTERMANPALVYEEMINAVVINVSENKPYELEIGDLVVMFKPREDFKMRINGFDYYLVNNSDIFGRIDVNLAEEVNQTENKTEPQIKLPSEQQ